MNSGIGMKRMMKRRIIYLLSLTVLFFAWSVAALAQAGDEPGMQEVTITGTGQIVYSDAAGEETGVGGGNTQPQGGGPVQAAPSTGDSGENYQPEISTDDSSIQFGGDAGYAAEGTAAGTSGYVEVVVTQSATITFDDGEAQAQPEISGDTGNLVFSAESSTVAGGITGKSAGVAADAAEVQYVEVVVNKTITITFSTQAITAETKTGVAAETCTDSPEISSVTINEDAASNGGEMELKSDSVCDPKKSVTIAWKIKSDCAALKEISIAVGSETKTYAGVEKGITFEGKYEFKISDTKARKIVINAKDANEKESKFEYSLSVEPIEELPKPTFSAITVNGKSVEADGTLDIESTDCGDMKLDIKGKAASVCGEIESVALEADGTSFKVEGKDTWEAKPTFKEADSYNITLQAKDSRNTESEEFEFEVQLTKNVQAPVVTIEMISNIAVPDFGGEMEMNKGNLIDGKLNIAGTAEKTQCEIAKVEVSMDDGSSWFEAEDTTAWAYGFKPSDGEYEIVARATDIGGNESEEMLNPIELTYTDKTEEDALREVFEKMLQAYKDNDVDTFMDAVDDNFSTNYDSIEDSNRLEQALDDKFTEQGLIDIVYQVKATIISGTTGRIEFDWDTDTGSVTYAHTGVWVFNKEDEGWKLLNIEDDDTFLKHTSVVASITVTDIYYDSDTGTLTSNGIDAAELTVLVADAAGNPIKDGTEVLFSVDKGSIDPVATTMEGVAEVVYTTGSDYGTVVVTMQSGTVTDTYMLIVEQALPPDFPDEPEK